MRYEAFPYPGGFIIHDLQLDAWLVDDGTWQKHPIKVAKFSKIEDAQAFIASLPQ